MPYLPNITRGISILSIHVYMTIAMITLGCSGEDNTASDDVAAIVAATPSPSPTTPTTDQPLAVSTPAPSATATSTLDNTLFNVEVIGDCTPSELEQELWLAHNIARAEARTCGTDDYPSTTAINWHCRLQQAAEAHSSDMAIQDYFSHISLDNRSPWDRAYNANYENFAQAENIAAGQQTVTDVMNGWLNSPGHCANIMNASHTEMGGAKVDASGATYSTYWTAMFGRPY